MGELRVKRSSEDEDDNQDSSPVRSFFESVFEVDEEEGSEKQSRFAKLFRPVFRMVFPRSERSASGSASEKRSLPSSIFGIENPVIDIPHDSDQAKKEDINSIEKTNEQDFQELEPHDIFENDNSEETISDFSEKSEKSDQPKPEDEIKHRSTVSISGGPEQVSPVSRIEEKTLSKQEKPKNKPSAVIALMTSELMSRRRDKKLKKNQKKLEKRQRGIEEEISKSKIERKKKDEILNTEFEKQKKQIKELNYEKTKPHAESVEDAIKKVQEKIQTPNKDATKEILTKPEINEGAFLSLVKEDEKRSRKKEIEQAEIKRIIEEATQEETKPTHHKPKTERDFERKHEIKELPKVKATSKDRQTKDHLLGGLLTHDYSQAQSVENRPRKIYKKTDPQEQSPPMLKTSVQTAIIPAEMLLIIILGIILSFVIIKVFLT